MFATAPHKKQDPPTKDNDCEKPASRWGITERFYDAMGWADCPQEARSWARDSIMETYFDRRESMQRSAYSFSEGTPDMRSYRGERSTHPAVLSFNSKLLALRLKATEKVDELYATCTNMSGDDTWKILKPVCKRFQKDAQSLYFAQVQRL